MNDRLHAAGDPELRRALVLARSQSDPLTADAAAEALGVHRNVARARLDRLAAAGFLRVFFERRTGRAGPGAGRPAKLYEVAPETELIEFPERRLDVFGALLADRLDDRALRDVGIEYGRRLARKAGIRPGRDVKRSLERLCRRLGQHGFQVSVISVSADEATLACPTCPLRPIVRESTRAVDADRGMWAALLEAAVDGVAAEAASCTTRNCSDDHATCEVVVRFDAQRGNAR